MNAPPRQIGHYQIRRQIGRGGMGVIYLARDEQLQRDVALKAVSPDMARSEERLAFLKREARIIAQLNHPHIVQIHQLLDHEGRLYLVLEHVPGHSLAELIERDGALDPETAYSICAQIARAVEAAHGAGVVHCDLKPSNIRIATDGTVKVLDFGIASPPPGAARHDAVPVDDSRAGTPGYMAPEQMRGEAADARADIFSFGCVLFECLTGEPAFADDSADVPPTGPPDMTTLPVSLPMEVRDLIADCLELDVTDRLPRIGKAHLVLDRALGRRVVEKKTTTSVPVPSNLPRPTTSFVGRSQPLRALTRLLSEARLITLTGPGGCGKTRLSIELARRVMRRFGDGVSIAELASVTSTDGVAASVATALGVKDRPNHTTIEVLCDSLADRTSLLILDNCEHVVSAAAELADLLLRAAPGLRILATSRETLRVPGEHLWPVAGLSLPPSDEQDDVAAAEAVTLFVDRAQSVRPAFQLGDDDAAVVARICRRLDGIPLAIELAAARMKMLTPAEIDARLNDRFRLLTGGERGVPERHRTLRAALDWSYTTLSPREMRLLRALSVFAGGATLEGAAAVFEADPGSADELDVLDLLTNLVDKSLVVVDGAPGSSRYRLLETVRQYAAGKLEEAGEADAAGDRHLALNLTLAEEAAAELTGPHQARWLNRLEAEHENMHAALDRCARADGGALHALRLCRALMRFWLVHGYARRGLEACAAALDRPEARTTTDDRAGVLHAAAVMAQALGQYGRSVSFSLEALVIEEALDNQPGIAVSLNSLGNSAYYRGDLAEAKRRHEQSLAIRMNLADQPGIATSLNNLGNVAHDQSRFDEARRLYADALAINSASGQRAWEAINVNNLGIVAYRTGELAEARRLHERSMSIRRELGDRHGIAESLGHLGRLLRSEGDLVASRRRFEESLRCRRDLEDRLGISDALDDDAMLAACSHEHIRAARLFGTTEHLRRQIGAPRPGPDRREVERCLAASRQALGQEAFEQAVRDGEAQPLASCLAETLAWLRAAPVDPSATTRLANSPPG